MIDLWHLRIEITVEAQDFGGYTVGFMNIVTWAGSADEGRAKIEDYLVTSNWYVVGVEETKVIPSTFVADGEELQDQIDRARSNPNALILGTFHGYKVN